MILFFKNQSGVNLVTTKVVNGDYKNIMLNIHENKTLERYTL